MQEVRTMEQLGVSKYRNRIKTDWNPRAFSVRIVEPEILRFGRFLLGISLALVMAAPGLAQSSGSRRSDGCERNTLTAKASSFIDLELVPRAEQRAEALRTRLFDVQMREMDLATQLDDLDYQLTPTVFSGRSRLWVRCVRWMSCAMHCALSSRTKRRD